MHVAHDNNVLGYSYIVNFIHDATESYYERGKHGFMHLNNIKFPLFMFKILKLHLFCFPMLVALCFHDLFLYKILFIGSGLDLKVFCICFLMLSLLQLLFLTWASFKITMPILMAIKKELLGDNSLYFDCQFIFVSLSLGSCYLCRNLSLSFIFCFCAKNSI
jgi:hypothetical protein